jgi:hypothetical protein
MLLAIDGDRPMFDQAGANPVRALGILAPDGSRPKAPVTKRAIVGSEPRRSTGTPYLSASSTQQPTPPTAR